MKTVFFLLLLILCSENSLGQSPGWAWAKTAGINGETWTHDVCLHVNGDVYAVGYFKDSISLDGFKLISSGDRDIFIARYDAAGNVVWLKKAGGSGSDEAKGISVDANGIYVTGYFSGTSYFDAQSVNSIGFSDIFIAKYDFNGDVVWLKRAGSDLPDEGFKIKADNRGHIFLTGTFSEYGAQPTVYKTAGFDTISVTSNGDTDIFLAKYTTNGDAIWVRGGGGLSTDHTEGLSVDTSGNIYVFGFFRPSWCKFNQIQINFVGSGFLISNFFLVKYDSIGTPVWGRGIGAIGSTNSAASSLELGGIVVSSSGFIYISGSYNNCDVRLHTGQILPEIGDYDIFLVKYATNGNVVWARNAGNTGGDATLGIALDQAENLYITGFHNGAYFSSLTPTFYGAYDTYIASYDSGGTVRWVIGAGGTGSETANAISCNPAGTEIAIGGFWSGNTAYFGSGSIINNSSGYNMFVAKLNTTTAIEPTPAKSLADLRIFPNPASDRVTLAARDISQEAITIYDPVGRRVMLVFKEVKRDVLVLDSSTLPDGMYFVQFNTSAQSSNYRLLIKH
jgi:hypothetical protein